MADVKLTNIADVTGTYDSITTTLISEAIIPDLISGLTIVKTAKLQHLAVLVNSIPHFQDILILNENLF